jgi:hypothetical protein
MFISQIYRRADAFLFGRRTYEIFTGSWGAMADPGGNPIWTALNTKPKYVASTTLTEPKWSDTTVLSDDLATAIADLKAKRVGSTSSPCSPSRWSSARARGCSPTPARTQRSTWWNHGPPRRR